MSRKQQKQHTKQKIIDTATSLFKEHGFEKVSTRKIATACNIAVGTVFSHFSDKDSLIKAIFHQAIDEQLTQYCQQAESTQSGLSYFLGMADVFYRFYQQDRAFSLTLLKSSLSDMNYFEAQMESLIAQVILRLTQDAQHLSVAQKYAVTKAWFGYYIFNVFNGLSQPDTNASDWHKHLTNECQLLLDAVNQS